MYYTVKETAEITGLSLATLRYYDKMGLFPHLQRKESGHRMFSDNDISMLKVIDSFKQAGFQINEIQTYIALAEQGDSTLQARYEICMKQEQRLREKIRELQNALEIAQENLAYYRIAFEEGTEALPEAFSIK